MSSGVEYVDPKLFGGETDNIPETSSLFLPIENHPSVLPDTPSSLLRLRDLPDS